MKTLSQTALIISGFFLWVMPAQAAGNAMNPRVRAHVGAVITEGPNPVGITGGMESRMSRLLYVDLGAMFNPAQVQLDEAETMELSQTFLVRDYIYILPGLRIPHKQPVNFQWDFNLRAGPAVLWSAYVGDVLNPETLYDELEMDVSMLTGADLGLMFGSMGLRFSGRVVLAMPFDQAQGKGRFIWVPQGGLEAFYQF